MVMKPTTINKRINHYGGVQVPQKPSQRVAPTCNALEYTDLAATERRSILQAASISTLGITLPAFAKDKKKELAEFVDNSKGFKFEYPRTWTEVQVEGVDILFKDLIDPLENCSVKTAPTEKRDINDYGKLDEVASDLAVRVLSPPGQDITLKGIREIDLENLRYYDFDFIADAKKYKRHDFVRVTIYNGQIYLFKIGTNEKKFNLNKSRLLDAQDSFAVFQPGSMPTDSGKEKIMVTYN